MKCPKCGYVSFDYAETCPKCNRDITAERGKLNLPSFEPAPLSLLGALIGEGGGPQINSRLQEAEDASSVRQDLAITLEELQAIDSAEEESKGDDDVELQLEPASIEELEESQEPVDLSGPVPITEDIVIPEERPPMDMSREELSLDVEDLVFEGPETGPLHTEETDEYEIVLEPDLFLPERPEAEKAAIPEPPEGEEETFTFELGGLPEDESVAVSDQEVLMEGQEGSRVDLDELVSMVEELTEDESAPDTESQPQTEKTQEVSPRTQTGPHDKNLFADPEAFELELELEKTDDEPP